MINSHQTTQLPLETFKPISNLTAQSAALTVLGGLNVEFTVWPSSTLQ